MTSPEFDNISDHEDLMSNIKKMEQQREMNDRKEDNFHFYMEWKNYLDSLTNQVGGLVDDSYVLLKELRKFSSQSQSTDLKNDYSALLNIIENIKADVEYLFKVLRQQVYLPEESELSVLKSQSKTCENDSNRPSRSDYWDYIYQQILAEIYNLETEILEQVQVVYYSKQPAKHMKADVFKLLGQLLNMHDEIFYQILSNLIYKKVVLDIDLGTQFQEYEEQEVVNSYEYAVDMEAAHKYIPAAKSFTAVESTMGAFYHGGAKAKKTKGSKDQNQYLHYSKSVSSLVTLVHSVFKMRSFVLNNFTKPANTEYLETYFISPLAVTETKLANPFLKPELMFNLSAEIDLTNSKRKKIREEIFAKKAEYLKLKSEIDTFKDSSISNPRYMDLVAKFTEQEWESFAITMNTRKLETELKRLRMQRASDDLKFRDIQDNCKVLEDRIFPKVENHSRIIHELSKELVYIKKEYEVLPEVFKKEKVANEKLEEECRTAITERAEAMKLINEQRTELVEIEKNFNKKEKISGMALHNSNELKERIESLKEQVQRMSIENEQQKSKIDNFDTETAHMNIKYESLQEENKRLKRRQNELGEQKLSIFMNIKGRMQENELLREMRPPMKLEMRYNRWLEKAGSEYIRYNLSEEENRKYKLTDEQVDWLKSQKITLLEYEK